MPSIQGRRENATGNQSLLLARIALRPTGNNSRHTLVAVEHQHPFAVSDRIWALSCAFRSLTLTRRGMDQGGRPRQP
jgi:hypothetical protein